MKTLQLSVFVGMLLSLIACQEKPTPQAQLPAPTSGKTQVRIVDEGENQGSREAWFELMHAAEPGTDWKALEYQTAKARVQRLRQGAKENTGFADNRIQATWHERGSLNQAGSIRDVEYDPETDEIFAIADGGTLFKSLRDGSNWSVVNQDYRFDKDLLKIYRNGNDRRIIAAIGRVPHYSDDEGQTWDEASGISYTNSGGQFKQSAISSTNEFIYFVAKASSGGQYNLYRSEDQGESYQSITNLGTSNRDLVHIFQAPGYDNLLIFLQGSNGRLSVYELAEDEDQIQLLHISNMQTGGEPLHITGAVHNGTLRLYRYFGSSYQVEYSLDTARTWVEQGRHAERPWRDASMYALPSEPGVVFMGAVECYRSTNDGENWTKANNWFDYYDDVENKLHADMMYFKEFQTKQGEDFLLVSNHGGLSVSYNDGWTYKNIGLSGLNVSQYYDVVSPEGLPEVIYAGTQDQGFQRAVEFRQSQDVVNFDQVISGDYGHLTFAGEDLWMVYPDGWITVYSNPISSTLDASWQLTNNNSVWIPPLHAYDDNIDPGEGSSVVLGGGNFEGVASGAYLIELTYDYSRPNIIAEQGEFDFRQASGGSISAIDIADINTQHWYVATTNGRFFYSLDAGDTWTQHAGSLPRGDGAYGQALCASGLTDGLVFLGGSGYSNAPVWMSQDSGQTFQEIDEGMPPTLVYDLALSPTEEYLFAATEAGPYVYVFEEERWYDLNDGSIPVNIYWSVQYMSLQGQDDIVRFGTYGRGAWDLTIQDIILSTSNATSIKLADIKVFPNPASEMINIESTVLEAGGSSIQLFDMQGRQVMERDLQSRAERTSLSVAGLPPGTYSLHLHNRDGLRAVTQLLVKH